MKKLWKRNCKEKTRIFEHSRLSREKFNYISMQEKLLILGILFLLFFWVTMKSFQAFAFKNEPSDILKKLKKNFIKKFEMVWAA